MKLLYSDILPLGVNEDQMTVIECIQEQLRNCDEVNIAVGYVSKAALEELDSLVAKDNIQHIHLLVGMY